MVGNCFYYLTSSWNAIIYRERKIIAQDERYTKGNKVSNNSEIVKAFIGSWSSMDIDKIMEFFTDDAIYINMPMRPHNIGKKAIRRFTKRFLLMVNEVEFIVHHQVENSNGIVMNERTDRLNFNGQQVELPVMGIFELSNGKIKAWRDYFDMEKLKGVMV